MGNDSMFGGNFFATALELVALTPTAFVPETFALGLAEDFIARVAGALEPLMIKKK